MAAILILMDTAFNCGFHFRRTDDCRWWHFRYFRYELPPFRYFDGQATFSRITYRFWRDSRGLWMMRDYREGNRGRMMKSGILYSTVEILSLQRRAAGAYFPPGWMSQQPYWRFSILLCWAPERRLFCHSKPYDAAPPGSLSHRKASTE